MFCRKCGKPVNLDDDFCQSCSAAIVRNEKKSSLVVEHDSVDDTKKNENRKRIFFNNILQLGFKIKLLLALALIILIVFLISSFEFNLFGGVRDLFYTEPELQSVIVDVLEDRIHEVFNIEAMVIESSNLAYSTIVPGGFLNPGTITILWTYESRVSFGVRDANEIRIRRVDDVVFINASTINVEVLSASVSNFEQVQALRSNPLVSFTQAVVDQIFEAQQEQEVAAAQRLNTDRNLENARQHYMSTVENMLNMLDLTIVWE